MKYRPTTRIESKPSIEHSVHTSTEKKENCFSDVVPEGQRASDESPVHSRVQRLLCDMASMRSFLKQQCPRPPLLGSFR